MAEPLHVVEPTLVDEAGHCHSFIDAVCSAGPDRHFEVWSGQPARPLFGDLPQVTLHPYFRRRIRRLQAPWLYRRLLREPGRIFVPTAGATELASADLSAGERIAPGKASFFFHWIRDTPRKRRRLARVARRQPHLRVLGAAPEIVAVLREVGFRDAHLVPYPLSLRALPERAGGEFRHLLFAGAARVDKGFGRVVDLVQLLKQRKARTPIAVQTSTRHYGKRDPTVAADLARLDALAYPALRAEPETLESDAYRELFRGAICLQPYVREEFERRVSVVTIEALASGSPVITTAGTWMADVVERNGAGIALDDPSAAALLEAVETVISGYERFSANARKAAEVVREEHSGAHMLRAVTA